MKKRVLYSTAVLATLAMASCSKDDATSVAMSGTNGANQVIEIAVENAGDGLSSRAGRPLYSSEAKQSIENVKIIVCDGEGNVEADTLITDWNHVSEEYNDASGHGRKVRFTLGNGGSNDELAEGTYTVYAFGYHDDSQYQVNGSSLVDYLKTVGNGWKLGESKVKTEDTNENVNTFSKDFTVTNLSDDNAEEIFAGSTEINVDDKGNFSQGVTLHRQVAGMFTYVYKIPYFKTAKYLKVYAVNENQDLVMGNFYSKVLGGNGTNNVKENVVNGTNASETRTLIYQMDLNNWFKSIKDVNNDGIIDTYEYTYSDGVLTENKTSANWQKPAQFNEVSLVKGSVFGGEFLIPFAAVADSKTFALELTDNSGTVLRYWNINLPSTEEIDGGLLTTWGTTGWTTTSVTESASSYSVLRNHLYGVGAKTKENSGEDPETPTDPEEPKDDEDDPQDLATKQDILLQVNDNWEVIHHMEVD